MAHWHVKCTHLWRVPSCQKEGTYLPSTWSLYVYFHAALTLNEDSFECKPANRCSGGDCRDCFCRSRRTHGGADADMPTCHWSCVIIMSKTSRDVGMTLAWHPFVSHCIHCFIFCLFQHTATNHPRPSGHAIITFCSLSFFISEYLLHDSLIVHPRCENTWHDNFGKEIDLWASLCPIDVSNKPEAEELAGMGIARSSSSFQVLICNTRHFRRGSQ